MKPIKLDKKDYFRALLTDTIPSDVPIVFSNAGLYINSHVVKNNKDNYKTKIVKYLYETFIRPELDSELSVEERSRLQKSKSEPFKYKIIKNESRLRTLSLVHPRSQMNYLEIYRENSDMLLSLCDDNNFSIRSPIRICNSFYLNNKKQEVIQKSYKEVRIDTIEEEMFKKHSSSFYSYKGYDRIYKFYRSPLYREMEAKFSYMYMLDVANCFDSIYTHTISWASKNKDYIKNNYVSWNNQFAQKLDTIMQRSNANETNGIPVGSEFSRIFAEVIFQDIDVNIEKELDSVYSFYNRKDYQVLRYVDDYIVFGITDEICKTVSDVISDRLSDYNLYINNEKMSKFERPFLTEKSKIIVVLSNCLDSFDKKIFQEGHLKNRIYFYSKIYKKDSFMNKFMDEIRLIVKSNSNGGYAQVSSYLVSVFTKRISCSIDCYDSYIKNEGSNEIFISNISLLIELMFFYYKVYPTINASSKIAKVVITLLDFLDYNIDLKVYSPRIKSLVVNIIKGLSFDRYESERRKGYISIEKLNVVLMTSNFGDHFRLPSDYFEGLINSSDYLNYFEIISLLYYFNDHSEYLEIKNKVINIAMGRLRSYNIIKDDSELVHLLLDVLCCPYI
ncbi:antiviral reverse transcriptase Drt3b, partial [Psychrobacter namhaensis]